MRTAILTAILLSLAARPAFAIIGHGHNGGGGGNDPKYATLRIANDSDQGVEASINNGAYVALEPGSFVDMSFSDKNKLEATISARLLGAPAVSDTKTATLQMSKITVARISASNTALSISVSKPGNVAQLARETGVALASTGGLLPLLLLSMLLGRRPRRDTTEAVGSA